MVFNYFHLDCIEIVGGGCSDTRVGLGWLFPIAIRRRPCCPVSIMLVTNMKERGEGKEVVWSLEVAPKVEWSWDGCLRWGEGGGSGVV